MKTGKPEAASAHNPVEDLSAARATSANARPGATLQMSQVLEGLAACLEVLNGADPSRVLKLLDHVQIGKLALREVVSGQLVLVARQGIRPGPSDKPSSRTVAPTAGERARARARRGLKGRR